MVLSVKIDNMQQKFTATDVARRTSSIEMLSIENEAGRGSGHQVKM